MKITAFDVKRFRSIRTAQFNLHDTTVLLGPNNEGKSNILRAMVLGMRELQSFRRRRRVFGIQRQRLMAPAGSQSYSYSWEKDFPLHLRDTGPQTTVLEFAFELDPEEIKAFNGEIGSRINGDLRVSLTFDRRNQVGFRVIKQKVGNKLTRKLEDIARFIGSRISVTYVPSIRTAEEASEVVSRLVADELQILEEDPKYQEALETIDLLREPRLQEIGESVKDTLAHFLPNVTNVTIALPEHRRRSVVSQSIEILVDDGHQTSLDMKGDGVQSLAAIALLRRSVMERGLSRSLVLAVEEPESHLHPLAIRELRQVISQIAAEHQVIVTTHSPLLADPLQVEKNIIVRSSTVRPAKDVAAVRDCLGVRLEDNLQSAKLALVVEGKTDVQIIKSLLSAADATLANDIREGTLAVEPLGGGTNLRYRLSQYASGVCRYYVVVDGDQPGRQVIQKSLDEKLLLDADYRFVKLPGQNECEIEDLIEPDLYLEKIRGQFGIRLTSGQVKKRKSKWSTKMAALFEADGKVFSKDTKRDAKVLVADAVSAAADVPLRDDTFIRNLATDLLERLHEF